MLRRTVRIEATGNLGFVDPTWKRGEDGRPISDRFGIAEWIASLGLSDRGGTGIGQTGRGRP